MFSILNRDPVARMIRWRDRADRLAIAFLEGHAVRGTITRPMVVKVADAVNRDPRQLVRMVPDLPRARRYAKAMTGLRNAGLLGGPPEMTEEE